MARQKAICLLGMHRSGTSAVTRTINLLGPYLGLQERLMPPAEGNNPDGFWEHKKIYSFHERLLKSLFRSWDDVSPLPKDWWTRAEIEPYREELTNFISKEFSGQSVWLWKDPRSSILLPLWQEVLRKLQIDVSYVLCLRNPLDVAESLKRRDGFSKEKALNLWLFYTASACHWTNGANRIVLCYDDLIENWEQPIRKLADVLGLPWPENDQPLRRAMADFIKLTSRHFYSNLESLSNDKSVPENVISLYRLLSDCEKNPELLKLTEFEKYTSNLLAGFGSRTSPSPSSSVPKVSVVIPSYNHGKYIAEAIGSVLWQTYQNFEIIITDDGSVDNSVQEIQKFTDTRIRFFCFEKNRGQFVAMRKCIEEAKGEYIAVLNSDDVFLPDKLQKQVEYLEAHPEVAAAFSYAAIIDDEGNDFTDETHFYYDIFEQPNRTRHEWLNYFFYYENCLCHPSVVIRSECHKTIGRYEERFGLLGDLDFWVRLCLKREIHVIPEKLVKFRVRKDEKNPSGVKLETSIRNAYEFKHILSHYLTVSTWDEFGGIFQNAEPYWRKLDEDLIPFAVAMAAIKVNSPVHQLFGLDTLFALLQDTKVARKMEDQCAFGYPELIKLTGKMDIFDRTRSFEVERIQRGNRPDFQNWTKNVAMRPQLSESRGKNFTLEPVQPLPDRASPLEKLTFDELDSVQFHHSPNPQVSIIVPVWNHWKYTYRCLVSILENTDKVPYEVIVVDNGSTDETIEMLKKVENIRIIGNETNLGYVKACNQGAGMARSEYLLFLNNDTEAQKGWLRNLLSIVETDKLIGAVGAKLVYPDGKLQEAGGIIFSDGRGWNFGKGDDPDKEIYNQQCEVDYCSAACLLVRRSLFDLLGSFDERYSPGYYEEADLCFAIRRKGYKVLYNPNAVVIHYESVTAGKDASSGLKRYLEANRKKFTQKWENELNYQDEHPSITGEFPTTANRERLTQKVTFENKAKNLKNVYKALDALTEERDSLKEAYLASEADRAEMLEVIERQAKEFSKRIADLEADRAARLEVIERQAKEFSEKTAHLEADRAAMIADLKLSMSWRITAPFRWILDRWNRISG